MAAHAKQAQQLARQLFRLSLTDGVIAAAKVEGVLAYVDKHRPANPVMVLKAYLRLVSLEVARSQAVIEHAGAVTDDVLHSIAAVLGKRYGRTLTATARPNPALIAGLRVRVGDDVYESSVAGQLAGLAAAV